MAQDTFVIVVIVVELLIVDGGIKLAFDDTALLSSTTTVWDPSVPKPIGTKDPFMVAEQDLVVS